MKWFLDFLVKFAPAIHTNIKKSEINPSDYHITGNIITFALLPVRR